MSDEVNAMIVEAMMGAEEGRLTLLCGCYIQFGSNIWVTRAPEVSAWQLWRHPLCNKQTKHQHRSGRVFDKAMSHLIRRDLFLREKATRNNRGLH